MYIFILGAVVPSKADPMNPLNEANKGFRLLQCMGWKEGEGLGREGQGRQQPVSAIYALSGFPLLWFANVVNALYYLIH